MTPVELLRDYGNHCTTAIDTSGRRVLVTVSPTADCIDLETGARYQLLDGDPYVEGHVGWAPSGYAALTSYGSTGLAVSVRLDPTKKVKRYGFAFHEGASSPSSGAGYLQTPRGVVSPDGTMLLLSSPWGTTTSYPFVLGLT